MKYKHIVWDWNGTLLDDVRASVDALNETMSHFGVKTISLQEYRDTFSFPVRKFYEERGFDFSKINIAEVGKRFVCAYKPREAECKVFDGAFALFEKLQNTSCKMSIVSAYEECLLKDIVERKAVAKYMQKVSGLGDINAKSKVELGAQRATQLGLARGEILFVGDTPHDFETAQAMSADCVLIPNGHASVSRLENLGAHTVKNFAELTEFIFSQE